MTHEQLRKELECLLCDYKAAGQTMCGLLQRIVAIAEEKDWVRVTDNCVTSRFDSLEITKHSAVSVSGKFTVEEIL